MNWANFYFQQKCDPNLTTDYQTPNDIFKKWT